MVAIAGAGAARPGLGVVRHGPRVVVHPTRARRRASGRDVTSGLSHKSDTYTFLKKILISPLISGKFSEILFPWPGAQIS